MASILSLAFWGYFYCFCLLHIIVNNDILQRVLRSVTKNGNQDLALIVSVRLLHCDVSFPCPYGFPGYMYI